MVASGSPYATSRQFNISYDSLRRHQASGHVSTAVTAVPVDRETALERSEAQYMRTLDQFYGLYAQVQTFLAKAGQHFEGKNVNGTFISGLASLSGEVRKVLKDIGELRGELNRAPKNVTVNVLTDSTFTAVVTTLMNALNPYPDARVAAAQALKSAGALPSA